MLFQEEDGGALIADPLDGLEDDVDQHWRQTRQEPVGKKSVKSLTRRWETGASQVGEQVIGRAD
jgi:hypothetical protein